MPFESKAQQRFMFSQHPKMAEEWAKKTPNISKLPEHVKKMADGGEAAAEDFKQDVNQPEGATDPGHLAEIINNLGSGMATGALGSEIAAPMAADALGSLGKLGETGELTLGKGAAPEMEGLASKIKVFVKGVQKNAKGEPVATYYGVEGSPEDLMKEFNDPAPATVPESVLRAKGLLPDAKINIPRNAPNNYAKGGKVKGYDDGGTVSNDSGSDWKDKLATVMKAMGMGASNLANSPVGKAVGLAVNPVSSIASMVEPAVQQASPTIQNLMSGATGNVIPPATPPTPPSAPVQPPAQNPGQNQPVSAPPQPTKDVLPQGVPEKPSATDLMAKLTDNDGDKMAALLGQLKDQDKRSAFAQALGVIGDTFGNMGQAKAGQTPQGFQTPQMIAGMNEQQKQSAIQNLTQTLASDPNSQTSKAAQMTLMQSMGIKPNDPRAPAILKMPAQAITQMIPQMTEAVKNNIEKEKNLITAKEADATNQLTLIERQVQAGNLSREQQVAAIQNLNDIAKNAPFYRPDLKNKALSMAMALTSGGGAAPSGQPPMMATNQMGHRIQSNDGGRTWQPIQ